MELGALNVRCNAVAPGFIRTDMTEALDSKVLDEWKKWIPLQRTGTPQNVADCCLFLGSDLSSYITGQVLQVDGGMRL